MVDASPSPLSCPALQWDVFCQVVDNYGDIGVCWRLAVNLAQRGQQVRLWVDDASALAWLAPDGHAHVSVFPWQVPTVLAAWQQAPPQVLVEAFGCTLDDAIQDCWANLHSSNSPHGQRPGLWLNLEYLTAEAYAARCHLLPSPVMHGCARGLHKLFFYPGFTADTGGVLRGSLQHLCRAPDWLDAPNAVHHPPHACAWSLFCYEPVALPAWLQQAHAQRAPVWVTAGRATAAVQRALASQPLPALEATYLPFVPQTDFDALLHRCQLNAVRGEDSLVRALWAGQALLWQIYPQHDNAHHHKLRAFLDWLQAPPGMRQWHAVWNALPEAPPLHALPALTAAELQSWRTCVQHARTRLLQQDDLCSQLLQLAATHHVCAESG